MKASDFIRFAPGTCAWILMLAGCGGVESGVEPTHAQQYAVSWSAGRTPNPGLSRLFIETQPLSVDQKMSGSSSLHSAGKNGKRLFASDTLAGNVDVYAWHMPPFKRGTFIGALGPPLTEPFGVCADKSGNVYVTNFNPVRNDGEIWEYLHGSVLPIRPPLIDAGNIPFSCAIDKKTGDIAVANVETTTGGSGSVYVYPGGKAPPDQFYGIPSVEGPLNAVNFVGYDPHEHLYADGSVAFCTGFTTCGAPFDAHVAMLASCCTAQSTFVPVTLLGVALATIQWPGAIVWDDKGHLDVGDREAIPATSGGGCFSPTVGCAALYDTIEGGSPSAPTLTQKTLTLFSSTGNAVGLDDGDVAWGVTISGSRSVVPNMTGTGGYPCMQIYLYPQGGSEIGGFGTMGCALFSAVVTP